MRRRPWTPHSSRTFLPRAPMALGCRRKKETNSVAGAPKIVASNKGSRQESSLLCCNSWVIRVLDERVKEDPLAEDGDNPKQVRDAARAALQEGYYVSASGFTAWALPLSRLWYVFCRTPSSTTGSANSAPRKKPLQSTPRVAPRRHHQPTRALLVATSMRDKKGCLTHRLFPGRSGLAPGVFSGGIPPVWRCLGRFTYPAG